MGSPASSGKWLALLAALLGWMFDGMEMGLFPLVARSALTEMLGANEVEIAKWYGVVTAAFLIGAATGGVLFGWLGDKIGRVRAMTLSVLVYSLCSGLSAASAAPWHLAALRFLGALGMGGEWALGVALVMEVWPNASRAWLAGLIGAFGNLGYTACGTIALALNHRGDQLAGGLVSVGLPEAWAATLTANGYWRLLLLMGAGPALLTLLIRMFVPESEKWSQAQEAGTASHWSGRDLVGVLVGATAATGLVGVWAGDDWLWAGVVPVPAKFAVSAVLLAVVTLGYLFPVRQYLSRADLSEADRRHTLLRMLLAAGISGVPLLGTWAGLMWMYQWVGKLPDGDAKDVRPVVQILSSVAAAVGCVAGAVLAGGFGRRPVYAALCVLSLGTMAAFYNTNETYGPRFLLSAGVLSLVSAAFYGWLPLYLPELFRTAVRATGQGFGFNFGRILAAVGALQVSPLLEAFGGSYPKAGTVVAGVYVVGLVLIAVAPETKGKELPA